MDRVRLLCGWRRSASLLGCEHALSNSNQPAQHTGCHDTDQYLSHSLAPPPLPSPSANFPFLMMESPFYGVRLLYAHGHAIVLKSSSFEASRLRRAETSPGGGSDPSPGSVG